MELKVFGEYKKDEYYLKLIQLNTYCIQLIVVNREGDVYTRGCLLDINSKGAVTLNENVSDEFGFDLDERGRLKVNSDM